MHPALDTESQLAQSQFAHLKTTQPSTTPSGITPGRALFDSPSLEDPPLVSDRPQRTRKPSARKAEASQSQSVASKSKGKGPTNPTSKKASDKNFGNASGANTSTSIASTGMAEGSGNYENGEDDFISQTIIDSVADFVGHDITHLSSRQIKTLIDAMPATQTSTLETQAKSTTTITQSLAGVGLASGDRNGSPPREGERSFPNRQQESTNSGNPLRSQKRSLDTLDASTATKRVRMATEVIDNPTEDESEPESDIPRHRHTDSSDSDDSDDSEPEARPPPLPRLQNPLNGIQGKAQTKFTHSKPTPTARQTTSSNRPSPLASASSIPSTSSNSASAAPKHAFDAAALLAHLPPPNDFNDITALAAWALQIAAKQAQTSSNLSPDSRPLQSAQPSATANHIAQALASHRSQRNGIGQPGGPQASTNHQPQSNSTNPTSSRASTPNGNNPTDTAPVRSKTKRSPKAKLTDFPGRPGEVASAAIPYFLATAFADGAYENTEVFRDWALDSYRETWKLEFPEHEYEIPPKALLTIMTRRVSWLRGEVKRRIRTVVQYGFGFRNPAVGRADIKHNKRLAKKLSAGVFHCRDHIPNTNYYEHTEFIRAIGAGLFWDPESLGVVFRDRFEVVPLPAVALILTMMQASIDEWKVGSFKAEELDADKQQVEYERHLISLYEYERLAGSRLERFRKKWFEAGLEYSGATTEDGPNVVRPYILASHIRPDTPPPEGEHEHDA